MGILCVRPRGAHETHRPRLGRTEQAGHLRTLCDGVFSSPLVPYRGFCLVLPSYRVGWRRGTYSADRAVRMLVTNLSNRPCDLFGFWPGCHSACRDRFPLVRALGWLEKTLCLNSGARWGPKKSCGAWICNPSPEPGLPAPSRQLGRTAWPKTLLNSPDKSAATRSLGADLLDGPAQGAAVADHELDLVLRLD